MCIINGVKFNSDVVKRINKFDIYVCDLGEVVEGNMELGKTRPCIILSNDEIINFKTNMFLIAPIRTEHGDVVTKDNKEQIVTDKIKIGRFYVPVEMYENDFRFIDLSQIRMIGVNKVQKYIGTIGNDELKKRINVSLLQVCMSGKELEQITNNKPEEEIVHKEIEQAVETETILEPETKIEDTKVFDSNKVPKLFYEVYKQFKENEISLENAASSMGMKSDTFKIVVEDYEKTLPNVTSIKNTKKEIKKKKIPMGFSVYYKKYKKGEISAKQLADKFDKHVTSIYNYIHYYDELNQNVNV